MKLNSVIFVGLLSLLPSLVVAATGTFTGIHRSYQSPRALGMGDAFIAVANDYSTLFYNPAGLARLDEGQINMSMDFSATSTFATFFKDVGDMSESSGTTESEQVSAATNFLQSRYGEYYSARAGMFEGIWVRPGWGIGVLPANFQMDMQVHNLGVPSLDMRVYLDSTFAFGKAWEIRGVGGQMSWGITGKFTNRGYISKQFNALDIAVNGSNLFPKDSFLEGYSIDADLGWMWTPYIPSEGLISALRYARPTLAAVVRNVGETGFANSLKLINKNKTEAPEKNYRVIDLGTRWEYPAFWIFSGRGTMDFRDIMHPSFNSKKALHLGLEFDWTMASWWKGHYRVGLNQGYWTAGFSALFSVLRLDFATWGEDIGSYDLPKENRNYMLKFNIDI